jgi:hypothetical protein
MERETIRRVHVVTSGRSQVDFFGDGRFWNPTDESSA